MPPMRSGNFLPSDALSGPRCRRRVIGCADDLARHIHRGRYLRAAVGGHHRRHSDGDGERDLLSRAGRARIRRQGIFHYVVESSAALRPPCGRAAPTAALPRVAVCYLSRNRLIISRAAADRVMAWPMARLSNRPITLLDSLTPTTLLAASAFDGRPGPRLSAAFRLGTIQSRQNGSA
jgi:hypothetical protein